MKTTNTDPGTDARTLPAGIAYAMTSCSLGTVLVAGTTEGVSAVLLGDTIEAVVAELAQRFPGSALQWEPERLGAWLDRAVALVERPAAVFDAPLDVHGTVFQLLVWQALRGIPAGSTATYSDIAARVGRPDAVRAVAGACAANPVAIAVPCHRVVRSDGGLAGYRWGIERKRALLAREAVA